jgi:hypothetical protein
MGRRRPPARIAPPRSRNNTKRRLNALLPTAAERQDLAGRATFGPYSKHKYHPTAYGLRPYSGQDEERTYCDEHAKFGKPGFARIPILLRRGILLGLWSEYLPGGDPTMLWTIDDNGWIYELRVSNVGRAMYHGYPVLTGDAFAKQVLARAREVAIAAGGFQIQNDPNAHVAIAAAEALYR